MSLRPPNGGKTLMGRKRGWIAIMQQLQFDDDILVTIVCLTKRYYSKLEAFDVGYITLPDDLIPQLTRDFHAFLLRQIELEFEYDENENNNGAGK